MRGFTLCPYNLILKSAGSPAPMGHREVFNQTRQTQ